MSDQRSSSEGLVAFDGPRANELPRAPESGTFLRDERTLLEARAGGAATMAIVVKVEAAS